MAAIIRPVFHYNIADSIYESIQAETSLYYYFIGRVSPWDTDAEGNSESDALFTIPDTINSQAFENEVRKNMVTLKQITIQDIAFCTRRIDWTSGTVYDQYDDTDESLGTKNFYVVTDDFNVYKCLSNNNDAKSTVKPIGLGNTVNSIPFSPFETGDGYVWKFMYSIPLILQTRFLTPSFMPVPRQAKNQFYSQGSIVSATINNGGSAYNPSTTSASISGDGVGGAATLQFSGGVITNVIIEGAESLATIADATGDGTNVTYETTSDHGFNTNQFVTITGTVSDGGDTSSFDISSPAKIVSVQTIAVDGVATFTVASTVEDTYVSGGSVSAKYPTGGIGYTNATITVTDTDAVPGSGADIDLNLSSPGDLDTEQADIETYAIDGGLSHIYVTNGSSGYTSAPVVTITGDGSGATATANIDGSGQVTSIEITNYGSGYTYAIASIATESLVSGGTAEATARIIVSPFGGHGSNAPRELFADTLSMYSSFDAVFTHNNIPVNDDYRQYGIISNVLKFDTNAKHNTATASAGYKLEGSFDAEEFDADEIIYTSGHAKELQVVTSLDNKMLAISLDGSEPALGDVFGNGVSSFTVTALSEPNVNKYSGEILFIDNSARFESSQVQEISFRSFIKL